VLLLDYLRSDSATFIGVCGVLGLLVGSFLNVVIYRLPEMMRQAWQSECAELLATPDENEEEPKSEEEPISLWSPRSRCPDCHRQVRASENVPVLSYLVLRGRCAGCGWRIPIRYPAVELLSGALSVAIAWHFGFGWAAAGGLLLLWALIALCFIDFDHQLLPDSITLPLLWLGLSFNLFSVYSPLADAVVGAMLGYGILWGVFHAFRLLTGKEGMGYGDFKLLAALGAWMGWQILPAIILLSSIVGAVIGLGLIVFRRHGREVPIPFGPYLAIAGLVCLFWGNTINRAYLGLAIN
jgi:leader peptidase (prepilin peptidase)/N-methyltransferase